MTVAVLLVVVVGILLAAAFVLAPLVHDEEDLQPLRRPRPGTRHLHGVDDLDAANGVEGDATNGVDGADDDVERETPDRPGTGKRRCPHCGTDVEEGFSYCGECLGRLP